MNYIGKLLLESYREIVVDKSYCDEKEEDFELHRHKYDSLLAIFSADQRIRDRLAEKLGVSEEDMTIFLKVLKNT